MTDSALPRPGSILGTRVLRTEDPGLLTGSRRYLADLDLPNKLHAVFVRSDVAHGTINAIHIDDAVGMPGRRRDPHRRPNWASHRTTASCRCTRTSPGRRSPTDGCDSSGNRSPSCSPRHSSRVRTRPKRSGPTSTRCPRTSMPKPPSTSERRGDLRRARVERGNGDHRQAAHRSRRSRRRGARPIRQPAHRGRPDGTRLLCRGSRRERTPHVLGVDADAARTPRATRRRAGHGHGRHPRRHAAGRRRVRRQGRHPRRVQRRRRRRRGGPDDRSSGCHRAATT